MLLDGIKTDAISLLSVTKDKTEKFSTELSKLKHENANLRGQLQEIQKLTKEKDRLFDKVTHLENVYKAIVQELDDNKQNELQEKRTEIQELKFRMKKANEEIGTLQKKNENLIEDVREVNVNFRVSRGFKCKIKSDLDRRTTVKTGGTARGEARKKQLQVPGGRLGSHQNGLLAACRAFA